MAKIMYERQKAVAYANRWWNNYNPEYPQFRVDCTNYISQCLFAGGFSMTGYPNRLQGWWYQENNWSLSWSVAHSFYWFLKGENQKRVIEVTSAKELYVGDVICYDFQGNSRWDHTTIVVGKDLGGWPLVNAHTDNSYHRSWVYRDSMAWTSNIQYGFFHIVNDN